MEDNKKKNEIDVDRGKSFKDLRIDELKRGYVKQEDNRGYNCIFCGKYFEEGVIYSSGERMVSPEKAVQEHVEYEHSGTFKSLIELDKQISGLSDVQKSILNCIHKQKDVKLIGEEMGISPATVRAHKFNLQKLKREAKIFLALMEMVEKEDNSTNNKKAIDDYEEIPNIEQATSEDMFSLNSLHPFFTQFRYK